MNLDSIYIKININDRLVKSFSWRHENNNIIKVKVNLKTQKIKCINPEKKKFLYISFQIIIYN